MITAADSLSRETSGWEGALGAADSLPRETSDWEGALGAADSLPRETSGWEGALGAQSNWAVSSSSSVSEYDTNCIARTLCSEIIQKINCHNLNSNVLN